VVDLVGGTLFAKTLDAMADRGRLIIVGLTAGRRVDLDLGLILRKRLHIQGTVLRARSDDEKAAVTRAFVERVLPLFSNGRIAPVVDRCFGLDEVGGAHRYLESNASFGNVVVRVG
jgi:NADPH:quinone reductase-like Zn-dependent oxidoreductase